MKLWRVIVYRANAQSHDGPYDFLTIGEDVHDLLRRLESVWEHPLPPFLDMPRPNYKDILSIVKEADLVI